ncbi:MAG: laccase domain-containing protein [Candidatus Sungbacteria bacterium]|nr:laccase domain-containing protein [Candidatus Sungbacteria bacterium]
MFVGIGPGICANCYDAPWIGEQLGTKDGWRDFLFSDEEQRVHCDLRRAILNRFLACGVQEKNMRITRKCTCCSRYPDRSYLLASHHRAKTSGPEESFLAVAALAPPPLSWRRFFGRSFFTAQL